MYFWYRLKSLRMLSWNQLAAFGDSNLKPIGKSSLTCIYKKVLYVLEFFIVKCILPPPYTKIKRMPRKGSREIIDWCRKYNYWIPSFVNEFKNVFDVM